MAVTGDMGVCAHRFPADATNLELSNYVSTHKGESFPLKKPAGSILKIGGLEDTIYRDKHDEVKGWGQFYLPETVNMQVVGVVESPYFLCDQLVLMTCEDKKLYAYDGEDLHVVASSFFKALEDKEIEYPASKSYYSGEAFKDMTAEDWAKVKKRPVGRRVAEKHPQFVRSLFSDIIETGVFQKNVIIICMK